MKIFFVEKTSIFDQEYDEFDKVITKLSRLSYKIDIALSE